MRAALNTFLILLICVFFLLSVSACKEDKTAEEEFILKVSGTWTLTETGASVDGVAVNGAFDGFSLKIEENGSFTTENGNDPIWPTSGKFTAVAVGTDVGFDLKRSDGVDIVVEQQTSQSLVLTFQYVSPDGRIRSVGGNYVFDLAKN